MQTSYFSKYKKQDGVNIALGEPKWFTGESYPSLYPTWDMINNVKKTKNYTLYIEQYTQILNKLDPFKVYNDLKNKTILCWEKSGDFCHRKLISDWIEEKTGFIVPEYDYDILFFKDEYRFLSNFWLNDIVISNKIWKSTEHIYQASKSNDPIIREKMRNLRTPGEAKKIGKLIKMRDDFDEIKDNMMLKINRLKFKNPELKQLLIETGNKKLIEGNFWNDNYFGKCYCKKCEDKVGLNKLGKILMKIRNEIK